MSNNTNLGVKPLTNHNGDQFYPQTSLEALVTNGGGGVTSWQSMKKGMA